MQALTFPRLFAELPPREWSLHMLSESERSAGALPLDGVLQHWFERNEQTVNIQSAGVDQDVACRRRQSMILMTKYGLMLAAIRRLTLRFFPRMDRRFDAVHIDPHRMVHRHQTTGQRLRKRFAYV